MGAKRLNWRKWNNILHRDIGYLTVGLTVIFAVSGIAVNHVEDWNPNYHIEKRKIAIDPVYQGDDQAIIAEVLRYLAIEEQPQGYFKADPQTLQIFLKNKKIEINPTTGQGEIEEIRERFILHDFNYLHLNHAKKAWTYFSDLYAIALFFLAISGMFVLKGRKGLSGRGKWLVGIGVVIPVLFLVYYKYW
ncbi:MAG TPA: hypothetical protein EYP36_00355 [Calditrichaeota bacterium]|nr:hypothetical protein [Calditrichota bacterium]